jgi:hypothetical protein
MRLLEQGENDTSETPPVPPPQNGGGENDAEMATDATAADKASGGGSTGTGPRQTAGGNRETNRKEKRRSVSPSESTVSKRTRTDSVSSAGTSRTSSFLPSLYYSTLNKREDAITPRVLGGGGGRILLGRLGTFSSDPRHILATQRHIFEKGINICTSFNPSTMSCNTCTDFEHPVLQRTGSKGQCFLPVLPSGGEGDCRAPVLS